jgi:diguanylate cyclase (GGDEF)-like protein
MIFAERLRALIESSSIFYDNKEMKISVSIGVASFNQGFTRHEQWIEAADIALYKAKEAGRNQVVLYKEGMKL